MKTNRILALVTIAAAALVAQPAKAFFTVSKSVSAGNSTFGANGALGAYDSNSGGVYSLNGYGYLNGQVVGNTISVVNGTGKVTFNSAGTGTATGNLSLMGNTVATVSKTFTGTNSWQTSTFTKSWGPASVSVPFTVAGIPFTFKLQAGASVSGYLQGGANVTYSFPYPEAALNIGPVASAAGTGSAGVGVGNFLGAGVSGSVKLSDLAVNARCKLHNKTAMVNVGGGMILMTFQYWADYGLDYSFGATSGNMDLYATVGVKIFGKTIGKSWSTTFWSGSWPGSSGTLYSGSSQLW